MRKALNLASLRKGVTIKVNSDEPASLDVDLLRGRTVLATKHLGVGSGARSIKLKLRRTALAKLPRQAGLKTAREGHRPGRQHHGDNEEDQRHPLVGEDAPASPSRRGEHPDREAQGPAANSAVGPFTWSARVGGSARSEPLGEQLAGV